MTKGRPATTGVDDAVVIARKRGCVMRIVYGLESLSDLVIRTASYVAFVKTRRTEKITASIREIEHAYHNLIAELRLFPESAQILRELWIYSKHGTYRFFRIDEAGVREVDRDGMPVRLPGEITAPVATEESPVEDEQISHGITETGGRSSPRGILRREGGKEYLIPPSFWQKHPATEISREGRSCARNRAFLRD